MNVLICDRDESYLKALVSFMMSTAGELQITTYSDEECFGEALYEEDFLKTFDYMILGSPYFELISDLQEEARGKESSAVRIYLADNEDTMGENAFYKYQSADKLLELMSLKPDGVDGKTKRKDNSKQIIGIISPIHHELLVPYAMLYTKMLAEEDSALLVDAQQISILAAFCGERFDRNLTDLVYMLESKSSQEKDTAISSYISNIRGLSVLGAASGPGEYNAITYDEWKGVVNKIKESGFSKVVVVFDCIQQGFEAIAPECDEIIELARQGAFYELSQEAFAGMCRDMLGSDVLRRVYLPFTAADIDCGNFQVEELWDGRLNEFVRKAAAFV